MLHERRGEREREGEKEIESGREKEIVQFLVGGIKSISAFLEEVTKICTQVQFLMLNKVERATRPKNGMAFYFLKKKIWKNCTDATPFEPMQ